MDSEGAVMLFCRDYIFLRPSLSAPLTMGIGEFLWLCLWARSSERSILVCDTLFGAYPVAVDL